MGLDGSRVFTASRFVDSQRERCQRCQEATLREGHLPKGDPMAFRRQTFSSSTMFNTCLALGLAHR